MTPEAILALYAWTAGCCFRCGRTGVAVARVDEIRTPSGDLYRLSACEHCILAMERERQVYAERRGLEYEPGSIGS